MGLEIRHLASNLPFGLAGMIMCGPMVVAALCGSFVLGWILGRRWEYFHQLKCKQQSIVRSPHSYLKYEGGNEAYLDFEKGKKDHVVFITKSGAKAHLFPDCSGLNSAQKEKMQRMKRPP